MDWSDIRHAADDATIGRSVSQGLQIAEKVLLPELRKTPRETIVISDGFSCREQIRHGPAEGPCIQPRSRRLPSSAGPISG